MSYEEYTWLRYYEDIYHRQKKLNNSLAVELGEITSKIGEQTAALNRVILSPFWKMLSPVRKVINRPANNRHITQEAPDDAYADGRTDKEDQDASVYARRLWEYEDYYARWISRDPIENRYLNYADSGMSRVREARFHIVYIEDCTGMRAPFDASIRAPWLLFTSRSGILANGYAERIDSVLSAHPDAVIAYADEDHYYDTSSGIRRLEPFFKPDWSPDTLDSFFYFGNIVVLRADFAIRADWYGSRDALLNVYDLFLQASDKTGRHYDERSVVHIPQVLFHKCVNKYIKDSSGDMTGNLHNDSYELWTEVSNELKHDLEAGAEIHGTTGKYSVIKGRSFKRRGVKASFKTGQNPEDMHIFYELPDDHRVSACILTKDHPDVLRTLLKSFIDRTDYDDIEFIIVDNGSDAANRAKYVALTKELLDEYPHEYMYVPQPFNFSHLCNIAADAANGRFLLFMNDDMELVQKDWLRLMAGYAARPHIGAVGAKLLYAGTDLIQHVGVTSMEIGPSHKLVIFPDDRIYYYGRNTLEYDSLGVTAACMMVETSKFDLSHGFNEDFPVAYNDVELCMRLTRLGYTNIQCNGALLYHFESLTRGQDEGDEEKWDRLLNEKNRLYQIYPEFLKADPYYNPNLIGNKSNYLSNFDFGYNNHTKCEIIRQIGASELAEASSDSYKIAIDFAGTQPKIRLEEPEITEIRGWSFVVGRDNGTHHINVILRNESDGSIFRIKADPVPRPDLEAAFPNEKNNRLCGFEMRVLKKDLTPGTYRVGIEPLTLNQDLTSAESAGIVVFTDTSLVIS